MGLLSRVYAISVFAYEIEVAYMTNPWKSEIESRTNMESALLVDFTKQASIVLRPMLIKTFARFKPMIY